MGGSVERPSESGTSIDQDDRSGEADGESEAKLSASDRLRILEKEVRRQGTELGELRGMLQNISDTNQQILALLSHPRQPNAADSTKAPPQSSGEGGAQRTVREAKPKVEATLGFYEQMWNPKLPNCAQWFIHDPTPPPQDTPRAATENAAASRHGTPATKGNPPTGQPGR